LGAAAGFDTSKVLAPVRWTDFMRWCSSGVLLIPLEDTFTVF